MQALTHWWLKYEGYVPKNAIYASDAYIVIRGYYNNEWIPGKFHATDFRAYVGYGKKEHEVETFEILVHDDNAIVEWVPLRNGDIPSHPVGPLGNDGYFVGKALAPKPELKHTPGKIHPLTNLFYLSWGGKEYEHSEYEALSIKPKVVFVEEFKVDTHPHVVHPTVVEEIRVDTHPHITHPVTHPIVVEEVVQVETHPHHVTHPVVVEEVIKVEHHHHHPGGF